MLLRFHTVKETAKVAAKQPKKTIVAPIRVGSTICFNCFQGPTKNPVLKGEFLMIFEV